MISRESHSFWRYVSSASVVSDLRPEAKGPWFATAANYVQRWALSVCEAGGSDREELKDTLPLPLLSWYEILRVVNLFQLPIK